MEPREWAFWIASEEGKDYFTGPEAGQRLLQFLKDNDPIECGASELLVSTCRKLEKLTGDNRLPADEIL